MTALIKKFTLTHLGIGDSTSMPVLVSLYQQDAKPNFSSTSVYARMDPIFTYQNTVRTFSVTCQTLQHDKHEEYWKNNTGSVGTPNYAAAKIGVLLPAPDVILAYSAFISDIYRMMYPVYERTVENGIPTNTLKSPPILRLKIDELVGQSEEVIFVPESFSVNSGFADRSQVNIAVSAGDLRFLALAGGYGFTLGGTILHKDEPPGFIRDATGEIKFSKKKFPFGAGTGIEKIKLANSKEIETILAEP